MGSVAGASPPPYVIGLLGLLHLPGELSSRRYRFMSRDAAVALAPPLQQARRRPKPFILPR